MAVERADGADLTDHVFCIRVGDWDRPVFRYVEMGTGEPTVVDDTLACLDHAHPPDGFDTPTRPRPRHLHTRLRRTGRSPRRRHRAMVWARIRANRPKRSDDDPFAGVPGL